MGLFDTLKPDYKNSDEDIRKKAYISTNRMIDFAKNL